MSRYIQIVIIIIVFFLSGCSTKQPIQNKMGQKSFETEDYMILSALEEQKHNNFTNAIELYKALYDKSGKINYLVEAIKISFLSKNINKTTVLLKDALKKEPNNIELRRIEIGLLIQQNNFKKSEKKALELLKKDKSARNLKIVGSIYLQKKSYELALKYFESAYKIDRDDNSLLNIVDIQYNYLNKKDDAIALLETHIRMYSCEISTCFKLVEIYGKQKNINGVISTYKKLYSRFKDEKYAKKVIELLLYLKDKKGAISFLEKSGYNQVMLLDIYLSSRDFANAYSIAKKLYDKTLNLDYLGKMAIYEYESKQNKLDDKVLVSVSKKFEQVVEKLHDPLYLNYYGYLLIDHNIDIKKGIELVKEALLREPNSPFFLDSLAWGYYKLGDCKKAKEIMDKLVKVSKEKELIEHSKKINICVKKGAK